MDRAKHIGYHVTKVVYRGYEATPALQVTHDNAVSIRMSLKLDAESEEQEQSLKEFRLKREKERIKLSMFYLYGVVVTPGVTVTHPWYCCKTHWCHKALTPVKFTPQNNLVYCKHLEGERD